MRGTNWDYVRGNLILWITQKESLLKKTLSVHKRVMIVEKHEIY